MQSLDEIYQNYSSQIYYFLLTKTGDEHISEELTQETFFQAIQSVNSFRGDSNILTWLYSIAKNVWLKYLRNNKKDEKTNIHDIITEPAESAVISEWENIEVLRKIHELNEPFKEVMYLRLVGNLTYAQIGDILGKSEQWTRVNFYRGKQKIIEEMK